MIALKMFALLVGLYVPCFVLGLIIAGLMQGDAAVTLESAKIVAAQAATFGLATESILLLLYGAVLLVGWGME